MLCVPLLANSCDHGGPVPVPPAGWLEGSTFSKHEPRGGSSRNVTCDPVMLAHDRAPAGTPLSQTARLVVRPSGHVGECCGDPQATPGGRGPRPTSISRRR